MTPSQERGGVPLALVVRAREKQHHRCGGARFIFDRRRVERRRNAVTRASGTSETLLLACLVLLSLRTVAVFFDPHRLTNGQRSLAQQSFFTHAVQAASPEISWSTSVICAWRAGGGDEIA